MEEHGETADRVEPGLDGAMAEAFGPAVESTPGASILAILEEGRGVRPRAVLRPDVSGPNLAPSNADTLPDRAGKYQVQGQIARGGVGVVLKSFDTDLGRDVAMKLLHDEYAESREHVQRFVEEAQIEGQLQHPGIVPVYDLGLEGDRPFFTMKLIKGRTLSGLLGDRETTSDDLRRFLHVFEQVCQAVAYAHTRGVIHRDLKPANVMVGAFGEVQVVDWGMGKVLPRGGVADETRAARSLEASGVNTVRTDGHGSESVVGSVMGTPGYMPPEQARGDVAQVDERSDVFSLGAILCEILTGQAPYTGSAKERLRQAMKADLAACHARLGESGADAALVTLAAECLAAAPNARPRTAEAVADQLGAWLASVQARVEAARLEAAESRGRATHERRARRLTLGLAATVLATILGGGGLWLWTRAEQGARERRVTAEVSAALRESSLFRGQGQWPDALAAARRALELSAEAPAVVQERAQHEWVRVETGAERAKEAARRTRANDELLAALDRARPVRRDERYPPNWLRVDGDYLEIFRAQDLDPDAGTEAEAAERLRARGVSHELSAVLDEWALVRREAENLEGMDRLLRVADLVDEDPTRAGLRRAIVEGESEALKRFAAHEALSEFPLLTVTLLSGALHQVKAYGDAVRVLEAAHLGQPDDFFLSLSLARALHVVGRKEESVRQYHAVLALRSDLPLVWAELGQELLNVNDRERAESVLLAARERWPGDGILHLILADALRGQGRMEEALSAYDEALRLAPDSAWVHHAIGHFHLSREMPAKALAAFEEAVRLNPRNGTAHALFAYTLAHAGRADEAQQELDRSIELGPDLPGVHALAATTYAVLRRPEEAIAAGRCALALGATAEMHHNLGLALYGLARYEAAVVEFRNAIELNPSNGHSHAQLALALYQTGAADETFHAAREAVRLLPGWGMGHALIGMVLLDRRQYAEAAASFQEELRVAPQSPYGWCNLAMCQWLTGQHEAGIASLEKGHELSRRIPNWPFPTVPMLRKWKQIVDRKPWLQPILEGQTEGARPRDMGLAAQLALDARKYLLAYRLTYEALAAEPSLADSIDDQIPYQGACSAVLAVSDGGVDGQDLTAEEKRTMRTQALVWLREELERHRRRLPDEAPSVQTYMLNISRDSDLAAVRGAEALAVLPTVEREVWSRFWQDVAKLHDDALRDMER